MFLLLLACVSNLIVSSALGNQAILIDPRLHISPEIKNVAIIGAGAAGSSAAYHLTKFAHSEGISLNVTVYERDSHIGGRSTTVDAYGDPSEPVELGASIFVDINRILVDAVREFGLDTFQFAQARSGIPGAALGVWNGRELVLEMGNDNEWWDYAKLFWRYGLAPIRTQALMEKTVRNFLKLYDSLFPFHSLTQAAQDAELLSATSSTGQQFLKDNGIDEKFANDVIQASTRVNYAQNLAFIHGLESMVCMATGGAMAVQGGNWQIFHHMIAATNSRILPETAVDTVEMLPGGRWAISAHKIEFDGHATHLEQSTFDEVILAAPYQYANVSLLGTESFTVPDEVPYVELHVTLLATSLLPSSKFFGFTDGKAVPHVVLTTLSKDEVPRKGAAGVGDAGFFSLSLLRPVINPRTNQQEYLYKIFSAERIDANFLTRLFGIESHGDEKEMEHDSLTHIISWIYRKVWHSYPYEYPRVTFEKMRLAEGLWYSSGIENFISTMETSALMGKNIAKLMVDGWMHEQATMSSPMKS